MAEKMTPQRMREIAGAMIDRVRDLEMRADKAEAVAELVRKGHPLEMNGHRYTVEEVENFAKREREAANEWAPLKRMATELQDYSFTMKG